MKELLEYIVKSLVKNPDKVVIKDSQSEEGISFELTVDPEDMGLIIGRSGQTIRAIRRLLVSRAMVENNNTRVNLSLTEV